MNKGGLALKNGEAIVLGSAFHRVMTWEQITEELRLQCYLGSWVLAVAPGWCTMPMELKQMIWNVTFPALRRCIAYQPFYDALLSEGQYYWIARFNIYIAAWTPDFIGSLQFESLGSADEGPCGVSANWDDFDNHRYIQPWRDNQVAVLESAKKWKRKAIADNKAHAQVLANEKYAERMRQLRSGRKGKGK
jgi:hypothetical protein